MHHCDCLVYLKFYFPNISLITQLYLDQPGNTPKEKEVLEKAAQEKCYNTNSCTQQSSSYQAKAVLVVTWSEMMPYSNPGQNEV